MVWPTLGSKMDKEQNRTEQCANTTERAMLTAWNHSVHGWKRNETRLHWQMSRHKPCLHQSASDSRGNKLNQVQLETGQSTGVHNQSTSVHRSPQTLVLNVSTSYQSQLWQRARNLSASSTERQPLSWQARLPHRMSNRAALYGQ